MDRQLKLISPEMGALMIHQMAHEMKNYTLYKSFANYYGLEGITALETYFHMRAEEEMVHHDWIHKYMSEADCRIEYPVIETNKDQVVTSMIAPFIATVKREIETTQLIYKMYKLAQEEGDYMTSKWLLDGLIDEQREEENTSRMARAIMECDGDIFIKSRRVLDLLS